MIESKGLRTNTGSDKYAAPSKMGKAIIDTGRFEEKNGSSQKLELALGFSRSKIAWNILQDKRCLVKKRDRVSTFRVRKTRNSSDIGARLLPRSTVIFWSSGKVIRGRGV